MKKVSVAYLLWLASFIGIAGLNRFYTGRVATGILWLITLGLGGFGILWDLFFIPSHVRQANNPFPQQQQVIVNVVNNNTNNNSN